MKPFKKQIQSQKHYTTVDNLDKRRAKPKRQPNPSGTSYHTESLIKLTKPFRNPSQAPNPEPHNPEAPNLEGLGFRLARVQDLIPKP